MKPPLMTAADWADYRDQTDSGTRTYDTHEAPAWLDLTAACPVCDELVGDHDTVEVIAASGDIVGCLMYGADWAYLPVETGCPLCGAPEGEECLPLVHAAPYCPTNGQHGGRPCTVPQHIGIED